MLCPDEATASSVRRSSFVLSLAHELDGVKERLVQSYYQSLSQCDHQAVPAEGQQQTLGTWRHTASTEPPRASSASDMEAPRTTMGTTLSSSSANPTRTRTSCASDMDDARSGPQKEGSTGVMLMMTHLSSVMRFGVVREMWSLSEELVMESTGQSMGEFAKESLEYETDRLIGSLRSHNQPNRLLLRGIVRTGTFEAIGSMHIITSFFPLSPHSMVRLVWDMITLLLYLFDAVTMPLILLVLPDNSMSREGELAIMLFWLVDIAMSFVTATYVEEELCRSFRLIAKQYLTSWLLPDVLMVAPEFAVWLLGSKRGGIAWVRGLRAIRCFRILRMMKMERVMHKLLRRVNSLSILSLVRLAWMLSGFLFLNHIIACGWYYLGNATSDSWFEASGTSDMTLWETYWVSLHWSITQFHGSMEVQVTNLAERVYAVVTLVLGMLGLSLFVSVITSTFLHVMQQHRQRMDFVQKLRDFFMRHRVPAETMVRVKRYIERNLSFGLENHTDELDLLVPLPSQMQKSLAMEIRMPIVGGHCFFAWLKAEHIAVLRDVTHRGFIVSSVRAWHNVFLSGESCQSMYFFESGLCKYLPDAVDLMQVESERILRLESRSAMSFAKADWICEHALWIKSWQNKGTLLAAMNSRLLRLDSDTLRSVVGGFPLAHFHVAMYARWVLRQFKDSDDEVDDCWRPFTFTDTTEVFRSTEEVA